MTARALSVLLVALAAAPACSSTPRVWVPPAIDLMRHELVGVVVFDSNAKGPVASLATSRFIESMRSEQKGIRVVELGGMQHVLASVGQGTMGPDALKAIGQRYNVRTVVLGQFTVSKVRPEVSVGAFLSSGGVRAIVDAGMEAKLVECDSGASIWSSSASGQYTVANVNILGGGGFSFDASDPGRAYGSLVNALTWELTHDFRGFWR